MTAARQPFDLEDRLTGSELRDAWPLLSAEDRALSLHLAPRADAEDLFLGLMAHDQAQIVLELPVEERRSWMRLLPPDDAADVIQAAADTEREGLLALLDDQTRREVTALLAYAEDRAGGLMNPRYARLRPEMTVDEAISYLRRQALEYLESLYYVYVLDEGQHLLGVVTFRELFAADPSKRVRDIMRANPVSVREEQDQESVSRLFDQHKFIAIPVVPSRSFRHSCIFVSATSGIRKPEDLKGKRVAAPEYQMTAPVWIRGILSDDFGVKVTDVQHCSGGEEEPGRVEKLKLDLPSHIK